LYAENLCVKTEIFFDFLCVLQHFQQAIAVVFCKFSSVQGEVLAKLGHKTLKEGLTLLGNNTHLFLSSF
jgi:hypothetical protein